jgi:hypothetical protein
MQGTVPASTNSSCATACGVLSETPINCYTGVTYSNLPYGMGAPTNHSFWWQTSAEPENYRLRALSCATSKVVCNQASIDHGVCLQAYLGATVTVQYPVASNTCNRREMYTGYMDSYPYNISTSPLSHYEEYNGCSQLTPDAPSCAYDDLQITKPCSQARNESCYNWASPTLTTIVNMGSYDDAVVVAPNRFAGDGLYLLRYCNTNLCNSLFPEMDQTTPLLCLPGAVPSPRSPGPPMPHTLAALRGGETTPVPVIAGSVLGSVLGLMCIVAACLRKRLPAKEESTEMAAAAHVALPV